MKKDERNYNIITFGKRVDNLLISLENNVIGTFLRTAPEYIFNGATIFLHCRSLIWGKATISSDYYYDEVEIWSDKIYPHRFKIKDIRLTTEPLSLVGSGYNDKFRENHGAGWAYKFIFAPKPLPNEIAINIEHDLDSRFNCEYEEFKKRIIEASRSGKALNPKKNGIKI